jgi:hypothetical protein
MSKVAIWDVSGAIVIPGTRKKAQVSTIRVIAEDRTKASKDVAIVLNERFQRELPEDVKFSDHYAIYNLRWVPFAPKAKAQDAALVAMVDANVPTS